jgi:integrase
MYQQQQQQSMNTESGVSRQFSTRSSRANRFQIHPHQVYLPKILSMPSSQNYKNNFLVKNRTIIASQQEEVCQPITTTTVVQSPLQSIIMSSVPSSTQQQLVTNVLLEHGMGRPSVPTAQAIVERMLQKEETNKLQKRFLSFNYDHHLEEAVFSVVTKMWKEDSTLQSRKNLWKRFLEFVEVRKYNINTQMDFAITTFCENLRKNNKHILNSTLLTYSKNLTAIARRLSMEVPISRMYQVGLRSMGADRPQNQAQAISFQHLKEVAEHSLRHPLERVRKQLYTVIYLMWKTCSRFDEVHLLQKSQITITSNTELIIDWSNRTKSSRLNSNRPDTWISVQEANGFPQIITEVLNNLHRHSMLFMYSTTWFDKWLKTLPPPLSRYSAHSFKAGAAAMLAQMVQFGHIKPHTVSLMAKHKTDHPDLLSSEMQQRKRISTNHQ